MPLPTERIYTTDDIYNLPNGKRAELIDGQIYDMAPPSRTHQRIVGKLYNIVSNYIESNKGSCEVYISQFAVFLNEDDKNYVEPDISVICDQSKLTDKGCFGAPGIIVYDLEHEDKNEYTFTDTVNVCIYPELSINFNNLNI